RGLWLPACMVRPAQTEGPYFVDTRLDRSDIRPDPTTGTVSAGIPLDLTFRVGRSDGMSCAPFPGVLVDVWQCDALGVYSGVKDISGKFDTTGKQFLRGHQRTDARGVATFRTIMPGWYEGRAVHIHFKLRVDPQANRGKEFTSQVYFDDKLLDQLAAKAPYATNRQTRSANRQDKIFGEGGSDLVLEVARDGDGYRSEFEVGLVLQP
ncbi:MAG: intradiol ring-cleavage dioxygenase, partial [Gemmatimonadota bacterium]